MTKNKNEIYVIPSDRSGLPGPLCRVVRDDDCESRIYVSLVNKSFHGYRESVHGGGGDKNLYVFRNSVLAMGPREVVNEETAERLRAASVGTYSLVRKEQEDLSKRGEFIRSEIARANAAAVKGEEMVILKPGPFLVAGTEEERSLCAKMAERVEAHPELRDVAEYLRSKSSLT